MDLVPWNRGGIMADPRPMFERFFDDPWRLIGAGSARQAPPVEVFEQGDDVVVRAEMAGFDPQDMDVRVEEDAVVIRGERRAEERREQGGFFHSERQYGTFARSISLPASVDVARARAEFHNGLLEVRAPRRADDARRGRRVDIQVR